MSLKREDIILREKLQLYNNIIKIDGCEGRLLAEFQIYPSPRIIWEVEFLDGLRLDHNNPIERLEGYGFSLEFSTKINLYSGLTYSKGYAHQAVCGDKEQKFHSFKFYLPNARFQSCNLVQPKLWKTITEIQNNNNICEGDEGYYVDVKIDEIWNIRLETRRDAIEWLKPKNNNIGTLITTNGLLYQKNENKQAIELEKAIERLKNLSSLLSYANGGYIAPLCIEAIRFTEDKDNRVNIATIVTQSKITPLETLPKNTSWFTKTSNLEAYIKCLPCFEKMREKTFCKDAFSFVIMYYFQALSSRT